MAGKPGKFDGLQERTDSLFDVPEQRSAPDGERAKPQRTAAYGTCEQGHTKTGLLVQGGHLVWRDHRYETWSGTRLPCRTSGVRLCDAPAQKIAHTDVPRCPCTEQRGTCADGHRVDLVPLDGHLTWAEHTYSTWSNELQTCQTSGARLCDSPPRATAHTHVPSCTCTNTVETH